MLRYVCHDLFESPAQTLVNTVNTVGVMGKGVAAEFKRRYPLMYERYRAHCKSGALTTGQLYLFRTPNKWVLNFPTKQHWRAPSRLEWIEAGLHKFVAEYEAQGITSVSFPQLGCGNGGLDWAVVKPLMDRYLSPLPISVFVHTRVHDPHFVPEHRGTQRDAAVDGEASHAAPASISFFEFFSDFMHLLGCEQQAPLPEREVVDADEPPPLPELEIEADSRRLRVPGEILQHIWSKLVLRGALPARELPGLSPEDSESLARRLEGLSYVKPIAFVGGTFDEPRLEPGIRYSPPPAPYLPSLFVPRAMEQRAE